MGGSFVESRDPRKEFMIVDRNIISLANEIGINIGIKSLIEISRRIKIR